MVDYARTESNYIDTIKGVIDVKSSNSHHSFGKNGRNIYSEYQQQVFTLGNIQLSLNIIYGIVGILFVCSLLAIGGGLVISGSLKLGALIATFNLASTLIPSITNLAMMPIPINEAHVAFDRMFEFSSVKTEKNDTGIDISGIDSLNMANISFRFPGRKLLLKDISLCVNVGEVIAIIGESGCGKSTIAQIIERFYFPEKGGVFVNNEIPIDDIHLYQWRNLVGYVPQFPHIFNGTVAYNILLETETLNFEKLVELLDDYGLNKYFNSLPQGLLTLVGEKGINLSGGQIQLIALSRVLMKNPKILVLDEITSAMDRETENFVLEILKKIKSKAAIIFISNRLHILKAFADRIYIIENNTIETVGNHKELLKHKNFYSQFWSGIALPN